MSSRWKTGKWSEALYALLVIIDIARDTLNSCESEEAEHLAIMLVGTKKQKKVARRRLMKLVEPPPKRPLYYLQSEIRFLPHWARDPTRYCGDYIDLLVKEMIYEFTNNQCVREYSLGRNINILRSKKYGVPIGLLDKLKR